jgi:hypothetical protein
MYARQVLTLTQSHPPVLMCSKAAISADTRCVCGARRTETFRHQRVGKEHPSTLTSINNLAAMPAKEYRRYLRTLKDQS